MLKLAQSQRVYLADVQSQLLTRALQKYNPYWSV